VTNMSKIAKINKTRCDGCGQCLSVCSFWAIGIRDGLAFIVDEKYCTGLGSCISECKNMAISLKDRNGDDFDKKYVELYLRDLQIGQAEHVER
jgi:MinD superfamily P-loop ATPase